MQPARSTLKRIFTAALRQAGPEQAPLLAWPLACGAAVAEKTSPVAYADGVLTIEVPDENWRQQLQELRPQYLSGINQISPEPVARICFVVAGRPEAQRE